MDRWELDDLTEEEQRLLAEVDARVEKIFFWQPTLFSMN